ncbi:MAG: hypothetical protein MJ233_01150 [Mycoplasmoidaceae bacterium]|nr:hypothetical protein [Mycoplasmoidaceae bacterium]
MNGFRQPEGKTFRKPSISLGYFDSITGQLVVPGREETKGIIVGDLYQIMSHDDGLVYGMLTLGQLCNIIDFILAGEDSFVYGKENNNTYHCDEGYHTEHYSDGLDYDAQGNQCVKTDQIGKQTTQSVYLAGPMQF